MFIDIKAIKCSPECDWQNSSHPQSSNVHHKLVINKQNNFHFNTSCQHLATVVFGKVGATLKSSYYLNSFVPWMKTMQALCCSVLSQWPNPESSKKGVLDTKLEGHSVERIPPHRPWRLTLTFQNLITSSPASVWEVTMLLLNPLTSWSLSRSHIFADVAFVIVSWVVNVYSKHAVIRWNTTELEPTSNVQGINESHVHFNHTSQQLVSWSLSSPFSTNMTISETKGQGWRAIPTQWRKASDILTSTLAAVFVQQPPKKEKGSRGSFKLLR